MDRFSPHKPQFVATNYQMHEYNYSPPSLSVELLNGAWYKLILPMFYEIIDKGCILFSFRIESLKMTTHQLVTLRAMVKSLSVQQTIKMEKGTLTKSSATLVDPTRSISAVFWEEWVNCVEINRT